MLAEADRAVRPQPVMEVLAGNQVTANDVLIAPDVARRLRMVIDPQLVTVPRNARAAAMAILRTAVEVMAGCVAGKSGLDAWPSGLSGRLRRTATDWQCTGCPVDPVIVTLGQLTRVMVDIVALDPEESQTAPSRLKELARASRRVIRELLAGLRPDEQPDMVPSRATGLRGEDLDAGRELQKSADSYVVSALRLVDVRALAHARNLVKAHSDPGSVFMPTMGGCVILTPCDSSTDALPTARRLWTRLGGQVWMGFCWNHASDIHAGVREASDLAALAAATEQSHGVFDVKSLALEYTALVNPEVSFSVLEAVRPLLSDDLLLETVLVLLASKGSRKRAARQLLVHRSTLNRRLEKIAQLTGHDPASQRGFMTFTLAMTARSLQRAGLLASRSDNSGVALA